MPPEKYKVFFLLEASCIDVKQAATVILLRPGEFVMFTKCWTSSTTLCSSLYEVTSNMFRRVFSSFDCRV